MEWVFVVAVGLVAALRALIPALGALLGRAEPALDSFEVPPPLTSAGMGSTPAPLPGQTDPLDIED